MSYDLVNPKRVQTEGVVEIQAQPLATLAGELECRAGAPLEVPEEVDPEAVEAELQQMLAEPGMSMQISVYSDAHDHASWHINNYGWGVVLGILDDHDAVPQGAYDYGDNSGWLVSKEESKRMAEAVRAYLAEAPEEDLEGWGQRLEDLAAFCEQAAADDGFEVW